MVLTRFIIFGSFSVLLISLFVTKFSDLNIFKAYNLNSHSGDKSGGWTEEIKSAELESSRSDIERIHYLRLSPNVFEQKYRGKTPVLIEGLAAGMSWPAISEGRWSRASLIKKYGDRLVNVASGAGIVYSGGGQTHSVTFSDFIAGLSAVPDGGNESPSGRDFIFDVGFLVRNAELLLDFITPPHFLGFSGDQNNKNNTSWYILSIGGSRSGLPFHTHGETWLGLVYGRKRWFLYPPGKSATLHLRYQMLQLPRLPDHARPAQFIQEAGDVVYLPSNWRHATLNIGEAVGVGGQALYRVADREANCMEILKSNPNDVDALRGVGLSLAHKGANMSPDGPIGLLMIRLDRVIELQPGDPEVELMLGEVLLYLQEREAVYDVANHLARLLSNDSLPEEVPMSTVVSARCNLARFMTTAGLFSESEILIKNGVIDVTGEFPEAAAVLSTALAGQDRWDEAFRKLEDAAVAFPQNRNDIMKHYSWLQEQRRLQTN